jgi:hypothetical protein
MQKEAKNPVKKSAKCAKIVQMADWLKNLEPDSLTVEIDAGQGKKVFTHKTWDELCQYVRSRANAKEIGLVFRSKEGRKETFSYALFQNNKWQSIPKQDVELLCSVNTKTLEVSPPPERIRCATFGKQYPDSPVRGEWKNLGLAG